MNTRFIVTSLSALLVLACDSGDTPDVGTPAAEIVLDAPEAQAQADAILELAGRTDAAADEARKQLPVPVVAIDLREDGALAGLEFRDETLPGGPAEAPLASPEPGPAHPDAMLDTPFGFRTVFGPDNRWVFQDSSYPFATVGRIDTPRGSCTGTMVGPRHVLTASHCIQWNNDNTTGWVRFRPALYNTSAPFGDAWAATTYWYRQVDTDGDGLASDSETAFDFVVIVLDRYLGNSTGWMGSKTYSTGWNGGASWANVGYPGDLGGAVKPVFQNGCSVSGTANYCWSSWCSVQLQTQCDTNHGQSGGPLYGTFSGSPSVIGVVSAGNNVTNKFAGGSLIPTLINNARAAQP